MQEKYALHTGSVQVVYIFFKNMRQPSVEVAYATSNPYRISTGLSIFFQNIRQPPSKWPMPPQILTGSVQVVDIFSKYQATSVEVAYATSNPYRISTGCRYFFKISGNLRRSGLCHLKSLQDQYRLSIFFQNIRQPPSKWPMPPRRPSTYTCLR